MATDDSLVIRRSFVRHRQLCLPPQGLDHLKRSGVMRLDQITKSLHFWINFFLFLHENLHSVLIYFGWSTASPLQSTAIDTSVTSCICMFKSCLSILSCKQFKTLPNINKFPGNDTHDYIICAHPLFTRGHSDIATIMMPSKESDSNLIAKGSEKRLNKEGLNKDGTKLKIQTEQIRTH